MVGDMTPRPDTTDVLLIGGRSGVGKSTLGFEVSRQLQDGDIAHCFIEGDNLDQVFPAPDDDPVREKISEANLAAMWANYRALGQRRLVYTNTAAVISAPWITRAVGGEVRFFGVLLNAGDETAAARLAGREIGSALDWHVERSRLAARWLERVAPPWVTRIPTDGRAATDIAAEVIGLTGWRPDARA
jgi:hypothetical protein